MLADEDNMTCVDVMYQPYAYFGYQRPAPAPTDPLKKYGVQKMQEALDVVGHHYTSPLSLSGTPSDVTTTKQEEQLDKDSQPLTTHYISSTCMLLTYFTGDIASNVDEHFSRALSQPSSFNAENQGSKPTSWKDVSPMANRNFPPSFWNSSYQPSGSSFTTTHHDPFSLHNSSDYMTSSLHTMSSLQDPWRYPLAAASQAHTYPHHSVHDFAYSSMAGTSRFNHHYSSLIPAAAGRLGGVASQCDLTKHADTWGSRYPDPLASSSLSSHHDTHLHTAAAAAAGLSADGLERFHSARSLPSAVGVSRFSGLS